VHFKNVPNNQILNVLFSVSDRTILLCTHHLDEADILGDRVVMMHQGRMICSGSPLYLKTHYGSGYHLTINKEQNTLSKVCPNRGETIFNFIYF
jgi:ABC-type multidrug transport system ATPase subunit